MKLRIIAAVLLLLFLGLAILEARVLRTEYGRACDQYQSHCAQILELDTRTAELQKKLESLNFEKAQAQQDQADQLLLEAQELSNQMETLRNEIETLKVYLEENQAAAEEAQAELTYLQGVYDALEEGLAEVEGYIAGN
jgi:peptidoglycan hydrolase CwlO-like protein